jgi:hypothetical protein
MARRKSTKRPYGGPHPELDTARLLAGGRGSRLEPGPGGEDYHVAVSRSSEKTYVCPACRQDVPPLTEHVVAWAADGLFGPEAAAEERRHWHTRCWETFGRTHG